MANIKGFSQEKLMQLDEQAENHCWENKAEIECSDLCICTACFQRFEPKEINSWQGGGSAVCPNPKCGMGGCVIGSASGLNFDDYDYS